MRGKYLPTDLLFLFYLSLTGFLILFFHNPSQPWLLRFILHLFFIFLIFFFVRYCPQNLPGYSFFRHWYPPLSYSFIYGELEFLNRLFSNDYHDRAILSLEEFVFGGQPSLWLSQVFHFPFFSEYLHLSYFSYYLLIPSLGLVLYFKRRLKEFHLFIFSITLGFFFCYLIFIFYPVLGPYYQFEKIGLPLSQYPFLTMTHWIIERWDSAGSAFPSSHVAIALLVLLWARRFERRVFVILAPFVAGLIIGTVYGRFHYAADTLAGILVGLGIFLITPRFYSALTKT